MREDGIFNAPTRKQQRGVALVVSMVILTIVTLVCVAAMQNTTLDLKLAVSNKDRTTAFQAAEAALAAAEQELNTHPPGLASLSNNCTGTQCFIDCSQFNAASSPKGRCFQGLYVNGQGKANCNPGGKTAIDPVAQIQQGNYLSFQSPILKDQKTVAVLIEFLCFVDKTTDQGNGARISIEENGNTNTIEALNTQLAPLYRITAIAEGDALRTHVVAQSIYRLAE